MKLIALILLILGVLLVLASVVVFFVTDCFAVFKDLKTTTRVSTQMPSPASRVNDIYYEKQAEQLIKKPKQSPPKFKRDEGVDAKTDSAFHQAVKPEQQDIASRIAERKSEANKITKQENTAPLMSAPAQNRGGQTAPLRPQQSGGQTAPLIQGQPNRQTAPLAARQSNGQTAPLMQQERHSSSPQAGSPSTETMPLKQAGVIKEGQTSPLMSKDVLEDGPMPPSSHKTVQRNTEPLVNLGVTEPLISKDV